MKFGGIQRCSTIDFPGTLSCVLFTLGCDLNCFYCHNRALLDGSGPVLSSGEIWAFLEKRRGLLGGVVLSGGEPTLQEDLTETIVAIREMGYRVKLDTNGQHPQIVQKLIDDRLLDYVAVDFKTSQDDYGWVCESEKGYDSTKQTIELLLRSGIAFEARTTLYPGLNETELLELTGSVPLLPRYRLNLYRAPEQHLPSHALLLKRPFLTGADLTRLEPALKAIQPNIVW